MMFGAKLLQPVNAASKRLAELAGRGELQARPATFDLSIQLNQAQLGQTFLMTDDTAALAHVQMANGLPESAQRL
jgi:hypothetical protein